MRLIDADKLMRHLGDWALHDAAPEIRECMKAVDEQPTVKTDTVNAAVSVGYDELMAPWCEPYVRTKLAQNIARELVRRIDIKSFDLDPRRMTKEFRKEFRSRVVIVAGEEADHDDHL